MFTQLRFCLQFFTSSVLLFKPKLVWFGCTAPGFILFAQISPPHSVISSTTVSPLLCTDSNLPGSPCVCNPHCHISIFHPQHIQPAVIFHLLSNYSPLAARLIITDGKCSYQLIANREMVNVNVCIYNNGSFTNLSKFLKSFVQCYEDLLFHLSARGGAMCLALVLFKVVRQLEKAQRALLVPVLLQMNILILYNFFSYWL